MRATTSITMMDWKSRRRINASIAGSPGGASRSARDRLHRDELAVHAATRRRSCSWQSTLKVGFYRKGPAAHRAPRALQFPVRLLADLEFVEQRLVFRMNLKVETFLHR